MPRSMSRYRYTLSLLLAVSILIVMLFVDIQVKLTLASFGKSEHPVEATQLNSPQTNSIRIPTRLTHAGKSRIWVQLTFNLEFELALMPHTLQHYIETLQVPPEQILVSLHHNNQNEVDLFVKTEQWMRDDLGIKHILKWNGQYTSNRLWKRRGELRSLVNISDCDWIVRSDSDELPAIPGNRLSSFLDFVGAQGYDAVFGTFNDRVAVNGTLPVITAAPALHEQFPLSCQVTKLLAHGLTQKAVAFRAYHRENRGGHDLLMTTNHTFEGRTESGDDHCGYPAKLRIDHYKWTLPVINKLRRRGRVYRKKRLHFQESAKLVRHIQHHNDHLNIEELSCKNISVFSEMHKMNYKEVYTEGNSCRNLVRTCPTSW